MRPHGRSIAAKMEGKAAVHTPGSEDKSWTGLRPADMDGKIFRDGGDADGGE